MDKKLDSRYRHRAKFCPCGKSNRYGKFVPFKGFENQGYCHSCGKTFREDAEPKAYTPTPELTQYFFDASIAIATQKRYDQNSFVQSLLMRFDKDKVMAAIHKYRVGTAIGGRVVFWYVDQDGRYTYGKIMQYDVQTGKRNHQDFSASHSKLDIDTTKFQVRGGLYGLHLLADSAVTKIAVVEGEKAAIVMSIAYPQFVWLATGGKGNFKYDLLKPIKKYQIMAFADNDAIGAWQEKAEYLNKYGFNIHVVADLYESDADSNADIADLYMDKAPTDEEPQQPVVSELEINIQKLGSKNQALFKLIEAFDLVED